MKPTPQSLPRTSLSLPSTTLPPHPPHPHPPLLTHQPPTITQIHQTKLQTIKLQATKLQTTKQIKSFKLLKLPKSIKQPSLTQLQIHSNVHIALKRRQMGGMG